MDEREREIIRKNHRLLVSNIILTEEFFECLRNYHVLPETMIKDIENESSRENKNSKLLELLVLRGCDSFRKLRHILHLTGHCLLADHLYGEGADLKVIKADEIFKKYPSIFNQVPDEMKMKFIRTIESKMKEKSLLNMWEKFPEERTELLETRRASFETEKALRFKLDKKQKQVRQISDEVKKLNVELRKRNIETELMKREENERKKAYKTELAVQAKFNAANSNSLIKLKDRFTNFNGKIRSINLMLKRFLEESDSSLIEEADYVKLTVLERNVKLVIERARDSKENADDILDEKRSILQLLNTFPKKEEPLSETVRKYLAKEEKVKVAIFRELERLRSTVRGSSNYQSSTPVTDLKLLRNMAATVRVEIEHLQKKLQWKESQISDLMEKTSSLKQNSPCFSETPVLEKASENSESLSSSPESTYEMQKAYENYDDYLTTEVKEYNPHLAIFREDNDNFIEEQRDALVKNSDSSITDLSIDIVPRTGTDIIVGESTSSNKRHAKDGDFEDLQHHRGTPNSVAIRLDVRHDKPPTNTLILPDIMESDMHRHGLLKSSADLSKILENSEDNDELEKITTILAKRTQFGKLPSIFQTASYLPE
ncbi:centrosomal protein of 128 kDa-like [Saccostrea echinata]|uniref:centrosomal protein of 128 kDa-like n=1 Tax=Saccostrea echinata TaxID=191078 RepID=UPI002A82874C|nr:centrosomal protein of 128 kDa-like [Saccostrea echinata]